MPSSHRLDCWACCLYTASLESWDWFKKWPQQFLTHHTSGRFRGAQPIGYNCRITCQKQQHNKNANFVHFVHFFHLFIINLTLKRKNQALWWRVNIPSVRSDLQIILPDPRKIWNSPDFAHWSFRCAHEFRSASLGSHSAQERGSRAVIGDTRRYVGMLSMTIISIALLDIILISKSLTSCNQMLNAKWFGCSSHCHISVVTLLTSRLSMSTCLTSAHRHKNNNDVHWSIEKKEKTFWKAVKARKNPSGETVFGQWFFHRSDLIELSSDFGLGWLGCSGSKQLPRWKYTKSLKILLRNPWLTQYFFQWRRIWASLTGGSLKALSISLSCSIFSSLSLPCQVIIVIFRFKQIPVGPWRAAHCLVMLYYICMMTMIYRNLQSQISD